MALLDNWLRLFSYCLVLACSDSDIWYVAECICLIVSKSITSENWWVLKLFREWYCKALRVNPHFLCLFLFFQQGVSGLPGAEGIPGEPGKLVRAFLKRLEKSHIQTINVVSYPLRLRKVRNLQNENFYEML